MIHLSSAFSASDCGSGSMSENKEIAARNRRSATRIWCRPSGSPFDQLVQACLGDGLEGGLHVGIGRHGDRSGFRRRRLLGGEQCIAPLGLALHRQLYRCFARQRLRQFEQVGGLPLVLAQN
jgi:hypothetical protein